MADYHVRGRQEESACCDSTVCLTWTALLTVGVLGVVCFSYWGHFTPILMQLVDKGQPDQGGNREGVIAYAAVLAFWILLIMWSLCKLVVGDPGFVTREALSKVYADYGLSEDQVLNMTVKELCLELTYKYLDKQGMICTREQLATVKMDEETKAD